MTGSLARESRRIPLTASAFVRALAALSQVAAPIAHEAFAQRVSQWFDWTHAIDLAATLREPPVPGVAAQGAAVTKPYERDVARLRAVLGKVVDDTWSGAAGSRTKRTMAEALAQAGEAAFDFATWRQRYTACQQAMDAQIGPLRRRVRAALADGSPTQAKLAELDGLMEQVVGVQERSLLAGVPGMLEPRFEQARRSSSTEVVTVAPRWLETFYQDARALLLAELDLRLQPLEGLLAAGLGPSTHTSS